VPASRTDALVTHSKGTQEGAVRISFESRNKDSVDLCLTESFTFPVLEPVTAVELRIKA
jgi:hypothetical protein